MRHSTRSHRATVRSVSRRAPAKLGPRAREGFTLPELMIAIIVITVGLLSLAGGAVGVLRQMRWGNQSAIAAIVATQRMETIRSQGCNVIGTGGTATTRGMPEKWVITQINGKGSAVVESVTYVPRAGLTRYVEMRSVVPCA
ncbi:MAG TPA: prepilin-type N-terminal cleavage/methylation domain-containing protein [Gemmatimonadaceae bacterium]|jgi:prepilin-type N-terminal cleavage/methylation domain-containing protein|nr:prepilin-type N-terminal cleavage/methylation domain-containing protein [Gemmatimonadaceae bacterium]